MAPRVCRAARARSTPGFRSDRGAPGWGPERCSAPPPPPEVESRGSAPFCPGTRRPRGVPQRSVGADRDPGPGGCGGEGGGAGPSVPSNPELRDPPRRGTEPRRDRTEPRRTAPGPNRRRRREERSAEHRPEVGMRGLRAGLGPYGAPVRSSHALPVSGWGGVGSAVPPPRGRGRDGAVGAVRLRAVPHPRYRSGAGNASAPVTQQPRDGAGARRAVCGAAAGSRLPLCPPTSPFWTPLGHFGSLWATLAAHGTAPRAPQPRASPGPGVRCWHRGGVPGGAALLPSPVQNTAGP